jgi:hypothetical protein
MKRVITKNTRIVTFFNSSHYWGGQLEEAAKALKITRSLKTHMESCFYSLVLQSLSVREHRLALTQICIRDDAQWARHRLSPVAKDVVPTVLDAGHWLLTDQLIHVTKPLVDVIGESMGIQNHKIQRLRTACYS